MHARSHRLPSPESRSVRRKRRSPSVDSDDAPRKRRHRDSERSRSPARRPESHERLSQDLSKRSRSPVRPRSRSPEAAQRRRSRSSRRTSRDKDGYVKKDSKRSQRATSRRRDRSYSSESRERPSKSSRHRRRSHSRSSSPKRRNRARSFSRSPPPRSRKALPSQDESFQGQAQDNGEMVEAPPIEKQKPNFKNSGLLAAETNKVTIGNGHDAGDIILKYHEPPEARKPPNSEPWNLYIFKGSSDNPLRTISLHTRSCWLLGREDAVADIPVEHPSCSKQHAVLQFRYITKKDEFGDKNSSVKLYLLDLESANGTRLNGEKVAAARYVECLSGDVIKLGHSEREYVLLLPPKESK